MSIDLSGGVWASGAGFTQTSGTPTTYAEYKQWMYIEYTRNPKFTSPDSDTVGRSLTQLSATDTKNVYDTRLHFNITCHNSCTFVTGNYDSSASYQAQKFSINANKFDKVGYSYGDVTGSSNLYVFGPKGSITTIQPYIRRNPKGAGDVEYSLTQDGTTDGFWVSGHDNPDGWGRGDFVGQPYSDYLNKYNDIAGGTDFPLSVNQVAAADIFEMGGGAYSTSSEVAYGNNAAGLQHLIQFIETNCACLKATVYNWRFCKSTPENSEGHNGIVEADRLAINPYYSTAHHDYT